jgi:hypothetical protein
MWAHNAYQQGSPDIPQLTLRYREVMRNGDYILQVNPPGHVGCLQQTRVNLGCPKLGPEQIFSSQTRSTRLRAIPQEASLDFGER